MNALQRSVLAVALGSGVALMAGCGNSSKASADASPAPTVTVTDTETAAPATAATPSAAVVTSSSASATPTCRTANLTVTIGTPDGATSHEIYPLRFTNNGSAACDLAGFPGVSYVTAATGVQIGAAATRNGASGTTVTLLPTGSATAKVSVGSTGPYDPATCVAKGAAGLRVYPPGSTQAAYVAVPLSVCSNPALKTLSVESITAG